MGLAEFAETALIARHLTSECGPLALVARGVDADAGVRWAQRLTLVIGSPYSKEGNEPKSKLIRIRSTGLTSPIVVYEEAIS